MLDIYNSQHLGNKPDHFQSNAQNRPNSQIAPCQTKITRQILSRKFCLGEAQARIYSPRRQTMGRREQKILNIRSSETQYRELKCFCFLSPQHATLEGGGGGGGGEKLEILRGKLGSLGDKLPLCSPTG